MTSVDSILANEIKAAGGRFISIKAAPQHKLNINIYVLYA
jgi:hypothetical protein